MKTVLDIYNNRKEAVGKIFHMTASPIGLVIYIGENDVYAIWDGSDKFIGGNGHLINTQEGWEPQPVQLLAVDVSVDELEDAAKRINSMKKENK